MRLYHVTGRSDVEAVKSGIAPPENRYGQYGTGFYMFRNRADAKRWARIRESVSDELSSILTFLIPDEMWSQLSVMRVSGEDDFKFHNDEVASKYQGADVLEGPWGTTRSVFENLMAGAWQYMFNTHVFSFLDAVLKGEENE
jgi:hypothetical protein